VGDEDAKWSDGSDELDDGSDPSSGARPKRAAPLEARALTDELERRAAGRSGTELDHILDEMLDEMLERTVAIAPPSRRDALRASLRRRMTDDPLFSDALARLRARAHELRR
jgi:hypothetical protein